jgi:hypothetical protein
MLLNFLLMSKQKSADEPKPAKWVKFVGVRSDSWRPLLDQLTIARVPYDYVTEIRFHFRSGRTYSYPLPSPIGERDLEKMIEKLDTRSDDLTALEFIIDLDNIQEMVSNQIKIAIEGAKDGK